MRERATPDLVVTQALKEQIPNLEAHGIHIQEHAGDFLPTIWQLSEWKTSGERQLKVKVESEKQNSNADTIAEAIYKKAPMLGKEFCRTLAHNLVKSKDFSCLAPFGLSEKDFKL